MIEHAITTIKCMRNDVLGMEIKTYDDILDVPVALYLVTS